MKTLKPNNQRAKNAIIFIWIVFSLEIISLISNFFEYRLLTDAAEGIIITEGEANANDLRQLIIGLLYLVVFIASAITFIMWFRRAYYNLHTQTTNLLLSEGWAAGAWFVPILCLFRPFQIMKELYTTTDEILFKSDSNYLRNTNLFYIRAWWCLWIINNFLGNIAFKYAFKTDTLDQLINGSVAQMFLSIIGIILAPFTVKVVKDYIEMENALSNLKENNSQASEQPITLPV